MQITSLSVQRNNPKRVNLFIDGKFLTGIPLGMVVENKLHVGLFLNDNLLNILLLAIFRENLWNSAINYLSFRPRSEKEVKTHLKEKIKSIILKSKLFKNLPFNADKIIDEICDKLKNINQINDWEFTKWWVQQRQTFRGKSKSAISAELWQKGIGKKLVDEVFSESNDAPQSDKNTALKLIEKRLFRWSNYDTREKKNQIYKYLSRRGFSYETIEDVIDMVLQKA
jgi:regulatory protein